MDALEKVVFFLVKSLVGILLAGSVTAFFSISDFVALEIGHLLQWIGLSGIFICAVFAIDWIIPHKREKDGNRT